MTSPARPKHAVPWQVPYVLAGTIWGCSFWFIKVGLEALSPIQVAFGRVALGASALMLISLITRAPLPRDRTTLKHLFVAALLLNAIPFSLFAFGETHISSVLAGIINAVTPLMAFIAFYLVLPEERASKDRLVGLIIGFAGVMIVLGAWRGLGSGEITGIVACLLAVVCYGISFPYTRRHLMSTRYNVVSLSAVQTLIGTFQLLPFAILSGGIQHHITTEVVLAMLALGILGSGLAYVFNLYVITHAGGTVASTVTYLTPIMAVIVGVAFLKEHVEWNQPMGAVVILLGAAITQGRLKLKRSVEPA